MKPDSADHHGSEAKDLVVFDIIRNSKCADCGKGLLGGDLLFMEGERRFVSHVPISTIWFTCPEATPL
jgi:hypothetical protein